MHCFRIGLKGDPMLACPTPTSKDSEVVDRQPLVLIPTKFTDRDDRARRFDISCRWQFAGNLASHSQSIVVARAFERPFPTQFRPTAPGRRTGDGNPVRQHLEIPSVIRQFPGCRWALAFDRNGGCHRGIPRQQNSQHPSDASQQREDPQQLCSRFISQFVRKTSQFR